MPLTAQSRCFPTASALIAAAIRFFLKEQLGRLPKNRNEFNPLYVNLKNLLSLRQLEALYERSEALNTELMARLNPSPSSPKLPQSECPEYYTAIFGLTGTSEGAASVVDGDCFQGYVEGSENTLLHWAMAPSCLYIELVDWLLVHGANIFAQSKVGLSPITCMLKKKELFEHFYQAWLLEQPGVWEKIKIILLSMEQHWQAYETTTLKPRERDSLSLAKATHYQQRREHLNKFFGLLQAAKNHRYAIWSLIEKITELEKEALRNITGRSALFDSTMNLLSKLAICLRATQEKYSRLDFICAANRFLLKACSKKDAAFASRSDCVKLPTDRPSLQTMLDSSMIEEGMEACKLDPSTFLEKSTWGSIWGYLQGMAGWLMDYEELLSARESKNVVYRLFTENSERLAARRRELEQYVKLIKEIFGEKAFATHRKTSNGFEVTFPIRDHKEPSILACYLKFHQLLAAVERGKSAPRGIFGLSDLHDIMARYAEAIKGVWLALQDAKMDNIVAITTLDSTYDEIYKRLLSGAGCELMLLATPVLTVACRPAPPVLLLPPSAEGTGCFLRFQVPAPKRVSLSGRDSQSYPASQASRSASASASASASPSFGAAASTPAGAFKETPRPRLLSRGQRLSHPVLPLPQDNDSSSDEELSEGLKR